MLFYTVRRIVSFSGQKTLFCLNIDLMILLGCNIVALFSLSAYIYLLIMHNETWDAS